MTQTVRVQDRYGNFYQLPVELEDYFQECQYTWGIVSKAEHEKQIVEEFLEFKE